MSSNWQSWITLGIITLTIMAFVWQTINKRRKKNADCGHDCDCPSKPDFKKKNDS